MKDFKARLVEIEELLEDKGALLAKTTEKLELFTTANKAGKKAATVKKLKKLIKDSEEEAEAFDVKYKKEKEEH